MKRAIFPGTFDPFTIGHSSVVKRALTFMDEIIIGIGVNDKKKTTHWATSHKKVIVGAIIDRPQTTAKPKRATNGRPYKQISAEILFSADFCYNGANEKPSSGRKVAREA